MDEGMMEAFKKDCKLYLSTLGVNVLRAYGRFLQLQAPTKSDKKTLIEDIVLVLCGELAPQRNKRGAPIKHDYVEPSVIAEMERLQSLYFGEGVKHEKQEQREKQESAEEEGVVLQFTIQPAKLNKKQKQRLNDFLDSL